MRTARTAACVAAWLGLGAASAFGAAQLTMPPGPWLVGDGVGCPSVEAAETAPQERTASVAGRIVGDRGEPVASADVTLVPADRESEILSVIAGRRVVRSRSPSGASDVDGSFRIEAVAPGEHVLVVTAAGFAPERVPGILVDPSVDEVWLGTVWLDAGVRVEGIVVDPDGAPIAGATVAPRLVSADGRSTAGGETLRVVTDRRGSFVVGGLSEHRRVQLEVSKPGFVTSPPVSATPPARELRIELQRAGTVVGRVLDSRRRPVSGAGVSLRSLVAGTSTVRLLGGGGRAADTVTDDDGRFELTGLSEGAAELRTLAGCCLPSVRRLEVEAGRQREVEIRLAEGAEIRGTVLTARREPVEGASISSGGQRARSDSRGRFRLRGLSVDVRSIAAQHRDLGRIEQTIDGPPSGQLTLVFEEVGAVEGRVVRPDGEPVAGARIFARCGGRSSTPMLSTDPRGAFLLRSQPGTCDLAVSATGWIPRAQRVRVVPGETRRVTISLEEGGTISGRILGASEGELHGVLVTARSTDGDPPREGRSGESGTYRIAGLGPGTWSVVAQLADGRRAEAAIALRDGESVAVDLELEEGRTLRGAITLDGRALPGAWVSVSSLSGEPLARSVADGEGSFHVGGLQAERVFVEVSTPEGDLQVNRDIDLGSARDLTFELRTGRLAGLVRDAVAGAPLARASVALEPLGDSRRAGRRLTTDSDGRFGPVRILEGRYRLMVRYPDHLEGTFTVVVAPGGREELVLELAPL